MSEWHEVKDADDIRLSDDKKFVQILFNTNDFGNCYVEVPVEMIVKLLAAQQSASVDDNQDAPLRDNEFQSWHDKPGY